MYAYNHGAPHGKISVEVHGFKRDFEETEEGARQVAEYVTKELGTNEWHIISTPVGMQIHLGKKGEDNDENVG